MPGNLLFADIAFPTVQGDDTKKDLKNILNYLYMLREELRYTMGNIGIENFNAAELLTLSNIIIGKLSITIQTVEESIAQIRGQADDQGSSLELLSAYTGLASVVEVTTPAERTDITKTYKIGTKYYRHNGTEWVEAADISSAALILAAINGQSAAKLKADNIDLTGNVTIASVAGLKAGTVEINGGCLDANTVGTDTFKKRRDSSNLDWFDFYAGINMTAIDVKATDYYPDTRSLIGLNKLRFHKDTALVNGRGGASNMLLQIGQIYYGQIDWTMASPLHLSNDGFTLSSTEENGTFGLSSVGSVEVVSGTASDGGMIVLWANAGTGMGSGVLLAIDGSGITARKYSNGQLINQVPII